MSVPILPMSVPILPKSGNLPRNIEFTPSGYRPLLLQRLELYLSGNQVLLGTTDATTAPTRNVGGWFNPSTQTWMAWNSDTGSYEPADIGLANGRYGMLFSGAPASNRTITFPNSSGTTLLQTDISVPKATVVLTGTSPTIDASISSNFFLTLEGNTTIPSLVNMASGSGKRIRISIVNSGTAYTVTWPTAGANEIKWPATPSYIQPIASTSQPEALAIYTISEANVGITAHLWGDPEVSGFNPPEDISTGGADTLTGAGAYAGFIPPPKGKNPFNTP